MDNILFPNEFSISSEVSVGNLINLNEQEKYVILSNTKKNASRVIPFNMSDEWFVVLIMKTIRSDNEIWLKAAFYNMYTEKVCCIMSTNNKTKLIELGYDFTEAKDNEWVIPHCNMYFPYIFWTELGDRMNITTNKK